MNILLLLSLMIKKGGMAMDILFKPRVEATEQMAENNA